MPGLSGLLALAKLRASLIRQAFPLMRVKIGVAGFGEKDFVSRSSCLRGMASWICAISAT
jgi:hypothetical protein